MVMFQISPPIRGMAQWLSRYQPESLGENPGTVPLLIRKSGGDFRACSRATFLNMGFRWAGDVMAWGLGGVGQ